LLRKEEVIAPQWVEEVLRDYYFFRECGVLPDNRGLLYNNPWLLEAFEVLAAEEGAVFREQMEQVERGSLKRITLGEREQLQQRAIEAAKRLADDVIRLQLEISSLNLPEP